MSTSRGVDWPGFFNARDLGGLGRVTPGAVFRSGTVTGVTAEGWQQASDAGIRTIVDLRGPDEVGQDDPVAEPPAPLSVEHVDLDDEADTAFWETLREVNGTPLYLRPFLDGKPDRAAAAIRAVLQAEPGGVLVHCGAGRDRTGVVALLLLSLAGATPDEIAADYALSAPEVSRHAVSHGRRDENPLIEAVLAEHSTTVYEAIRDLAATFDASAYLSAAGLASSELAALRARLTA